MNGQNHEALLLRFGNRHLFPIAGGLIVVMLSLVGWTMADSREAVRLAAEQQGSNITLTLERDVGRVVNMLDLSLRAAAQGMALPGLAEMDPKLRRAVLFDGAADAEDFGGVLIADAQGNILYSSVSADKPGINLADRPFFSQQRNNPELGLLMGAPLRSRRDDAWMLPISRRISNPDGSFAGIAVVGLRLSYFQSLFKSIDLGNRGILNLVSTDRKMIVRQPASPGDIGRSVGSSGVFDRLAHSPSGSFEAVAGVDGVRRLYTYRRIEGLPLVLGVGVATDEIFAAADRKADIVGLALLLLTLLGLGLAWQLRRELVRRTDAEQAALQAAAAAERLAAELAQALAPLDALFKNTADMMVAVRAGPFGDFTYEMVNPVWEDLSGLRAADVIGRMPHAVLPAPLADRVVEHWRRTVRERRATRSSFQVPAAPMMREWEAMVVPVFAEDGEIRRLITVAREITERNQLEEQLRQSQKMEVIGRLAAGVSHDFNNILQVITGGIDILRDEAAISEQSRTFLEMIDRAANRGAYLTHHLLAYSRKQALNPKLLDPGELVTSLLSVLSRTLGSQIVVTTTVAASVGVLRADRSQLETALMNLAINASHAMPDGGSLHFDVTTGEAQQFHGLAPGRYVVIAVTDTGTGMAPEVLACAFDPFFTTKGLAGTGLGLAMVQGFCRQSGGDVRVDSAPGEGTRFEVWLPQEDVAEPEFEPVLQGAPQTRGGRVLLVDDAADVLVTVAAFLRFGGFTVQEAVGGQAALDLLAGGERFDVLVTDYMMPETNGLVLIERARAWQPDLPAVVISGFSDVANSMSDVPRMILLHKPFKRDQLLVAVATLLGQAAKAPAAAASPAVTVNGLSPL